MQALTTPINPTIAALLHQLQAEVIEAAVAQAAIGLRHAIHLEGGASAGRHTEWWNNLQCVVHDAQGREISYIQRSIDWRFWTGQEGAYDAAGHKWERQFARMATDDFGTLVEVAQ